MKRLSTFLFALLLTTMGFAQIKCPLGGQSAHGQWSYGWTQTMVATADLHFSQQWGEFNLATTGLTEGATYKLTVAKANEKINLRFNTGGDPISQPVIATEITGTIPAGITAIELQATEANLDLQVVSFTINDVQTEYSVNWGTLFFAGYYTSTQQWAEIMVNGVEKYDQQVITVKTNEIIPEGIQLKVLYSDDTEDWPVLTAGVKTASVDLTKPVKQVSIQETKKDVPSILDIVSVTTFPYKDVTISPASGSITDALTEALGDYNARNVTINLAENGAYTISAAIKAAGDIAINGAAGATIDASAADVEGGVNFIELQGSTEYALKADGTTVSDHFVVGSVTIKDVTITGLKKAIVRDTQKTYLKTLTIDNSVIEASNGKPAIDFDSKGYVEQLNVTKSTIWAKEATNKNFTKYGSRPKNLWTKDAEDKDVPGPYILQGYDVENSTFVNIAATGQNFCNNSQKGTTENVYVIKNNIFVDCGKPNQVVVGFNGGQTSATPTWDVDGNVFNTAGADGSAAEVAKAGKKDDADIVKNSIAGIVTFTDAANGDFNYNFAAAPGSTVPASIGDPRWTKTDVATYAITVVPTEGMTLTPEKTTAAAGEKVYATFTLEDGYEPEMPEFTDTDTGEPIAFTENVDFGMEEVGGVPKVWIIMPAQNLTITLKTAKVSKINLDLSQENGQATCLSVNAEDLTTYYKKQGKEIYLNIKPADGYEAVISVTCDDADKTVVDVIAEAGDYHGQPYTHKFIMPAQDVTVKVTFRVATGINGISVDGANDIFSDGKPVYNLSGQRVFKGYKGVAIKNGRKIVVK